VRNGGQTSVADIFGDNVISCGRSQFSRGLRRGFAVARLLGVRVRIPPGVWMSLVSFVCCVLSGRGLCVGLITRLEETYRVLCVLSVNTKRR